MASVYSTRFFTAPSFSGAAVVQYTVPPGFVAVVKTFQVVWGDVTVSGLDAWVQTSDLTKLFRITLATGITGGDILGGDHLSYGTFVCPAGETLACQTASGTCDFYAGGYLLSLP